MRILDLPAEHNAHTGHNGGRGGGDRDNGNCLGDGNGNVLSCESLEKINELCVGCKGCGSRAVYPRPSTRDLDRLVAAYNDLATNSLANVGIAVLVSRRGSNGYAHSTLGDREVCRGGLAFNGKGCGIAADLRGSGDRAIALCIRIGDNEAIAHEVARAVDNCAYGKICVSAVGCGNGCSAHQLIALATMLCDLVAACRVYEIMVCGLCCACRAVVSIDGSSLRFVAGGVAVIYLCVADNRMGLCGLTVVEVLSECSAEHIRQFTGGNVFNCNSGGKIKTVIYRRNVVVVTALSIIPTATTVHERIANGFTEIVAIFYNCIMGRSANKTSADIAASCNSGITKAVFNRTV